MATSSPGVRPRSGLTLYHLADVRLGGAFPFLGEAGSAHRAQVRETFVKAVDQGLELGPSVVLVTGNLFGTPFPSRELSEFARAQIGRFAGAGIPVLLAAGPMDALHDKNYAAGAFSELPRVSVFPATPQVIALPDLDVSVVGVSWSSTPVQPDFLAGIGSQRTHRYLIGACSLAWPETQDGMKALRRQIAASKATYLAVGGSPVRRNISVEKVTAWCPGAPELVAAEEGDGAPLLSRLDGEIEVMPRPVARRRFGRFTLQPVAYASTEELAGAIRALGDPNLAAMVRLTGTCRINQFINVVELRDRLAREFLSLDIVDESRPNLEDLNTTAYPDLSVAGKFVGVVRVEMERATSDEARRRAGAALRLGLALLEGRQPS
ncbi:MAG: hypothetical protein ACT4P5_14715 [Armatimonadota bacterium]